MNTQLRKKLLERRNRRLQEYRQASQEFDEKELAESARKYFARFSKSVELLVVLYDRESDRSQKKNMKDRRPDIIRRLKKLGKRYGIQLKIKYFSEVCKGYPSHLSKRTDLFAAIEYCRKHNCLLVAFSVDRIIRPELFSGKNQFGPLLESDVVQLREYIQGIDIATIIPPGTDKRRVRGEISALGQKGKGNSGGRPRKKLTRAERKERFQPIAWELHHEGWSHKEVHDFLVWLECDVSRSGMRLWFKDEKPLRRIF